MFLTVFILSVLLVAVVLLALGIKMLLVKNAGFPEHSCLLEDEEGAVNECSACSLKDIVECKEKTYKIHNYETN